MTKWTFKSNDGTEAIVLAADEDSARAKAMAKLYGQITVTAWLGPKWLGRGLYLTAQEVVEP